MRYYSSGDLGRILNAKFDHQSNCVDRGRVTARGFTEIMGTKQGVASPVIYHGYDTQGGGVVEARDLCKIWNLPLGQPKGGGGFEGLERPQVATGWGY